MTITGAGGRIVCGPRAVAAVGAWTVTRVDPAPRFEAVLAVSAHDSFWWRQDGLTLVLTVGRRTWTWTLAGVPAWAPRITVALDGAPVIQ